MFSGERLKYLRKEKGLSQQELANMINASKSLISCYESGKRNPSLENIIAFMEIFAVSSDYLLGSDNIIKVVENNKEEYHTLTNEEFAFINLLRKDKLIYEILLTDPKRGNEILKKKLGETNFFF